MKDEAGIETAGFTRRDVIKTASLASLATAFPVFAAGASEKIRVGLIGCGGRGTEAAMNCVEASPDVVIAALAVVLVTGSGRAAGLDRIIHGVLRSRARLPALEVPTRTPLV